MQIAFSADGYDISIDVTRQEDDGEDKPKFRTGFCLPDKKGD